MSIEQANVIQLSYRQIAVLRDEKYKELLTLEESIKDLNRRHKEATGEYIPGVRFVLSAKTGSESDV